MRRGNKKIYNVYIIVEMWQTKLVCEDKELVVRHQTGGRGVFLLVWMDEGEVGGKGLGRIMGAGVLKYFVQAKAI